MRGSATQARTDQRRRGAVSLVEALVVVVVLGVLATLFTAQFARGVGADERDAFCAQLREHLAGVERFYLDTGTYPPAAAAGAVPTGFDKYVDAGRWADETPIGGRWDMEFEGLGITSALGVRFDGDAPDAAFMAEVDAALDDGQLGTGSFRELAPGRFYFVVLD